MDRKDFLLTAGRLGLACCGASMFGAAPSTAQTATPATSAEASRVEWTKTWTKRFFDIVDAQLDEPARRRLMEEQGKTCFLGSLKGREIKPQPVDRLVEALNTRAGETCIRREGNALYYNYVKNPRGLRVSDGYCLCPLVEDGPPGLSKTFCYCSVGYVRQMFTLALGQPVKVELLESLKGGGQSCRFRIDLT